MPTDRQKLAVDNMIKNGGIASRAMVDAGYSPATAKTPQKLTESDGYLQIMDDLGLTENFLVKALKEDIDKKPQNRKPEIELAVKMRGMITDRKDITSGGDKILTNSIVFENFKDAPKDK